MDSFEFSDEKKEIKVHLDKWLWAARFFKTLALSRAAIGQDKVIYNGQKPKPTLEIEEGATIIINLGRIVKSVVVKNLSTRRKSTAEAMELYEELAQETREFNSYRHRQSRQHNKTSNNSIRFLRRASTNKNSDLPNYDTLSTEADF